MVPLSAHQAWQSNVPLFLPQRCFSHGTPFLIKAKSSIHLPTLETLALSPPLLDSFCPQVPASTISPFEWVPSSQCHNSSPDSTCFLLEHAASLSSLSSSFPLSLLPKLLFSINTDLGMPLHFLKTVHSSPSPLEDTECPSQTGPSALFTLSFCYCTSQTPQPSQKGGCAVSHKDPVLFCLCLDLLAWNSPSRSLQAYLSLLL